MLSLEPATVTDRRYPLLFQTGETAYGKPIVDGQHPHNLIMALGFHYARITGRGHDAGFVLRAGGRSGAGAGGVSASGFGDGTAASAAVASLAGFDAYRG